MGKLITFEQLQDIVKLKGFNLVDKIYNKALSKITVYDNYGYYYTTSYNQLQQNRMPERFHKYNIYTLKNIEHYLKTNNIDLILLDNTYINSLKKMTFKDSNGYLYYSTLNNIIANKKPNTFDKSNIYTINNINLWIRNNNIDLILLNNNFKNALTKMTFKDYYGYYYFVSWNTIQQNHFPERFHKSNPYTIQNIKLWCKLNNKPFELVSEKYIDSTFNKLKWHCLKEECMDVFESSWMSIINGFGCGVCDGRQVTLSNCLATTHPDLAKEWHPTKNGDLTPYDVTIGCNKSIWWQCSNNPKHEWAISVNARSYNGCPYCCHNPKSNEDYNLLVNNPELCKEWNYEKNDKNPVEYTPNSGQHVWWKCKDCGYEWKTSICCRNGKRKTGCPKCAESKGEKQLDLILTKYNIPHDSQYTFDDLVGIGGGLLRFDSSVFWDKEQTRLRMLIEYDGEFHYKKFYKDDGFETLQIHDELKNQYCKDNGIKLVRIPYWDFNNIENILIKSLNLEE